MTTLDDVRGLISPLSPNPVCDDCISDKLNLGARQHANRHARQLTGASGFERRRDICSLCFGEKLVTRWVRPAP